MFANCKDELPNPHKNCIREMLNTLICQDNDVKRLNLELRNLQRELKHEIDKVQLKCAKVPKAICESSEDMTNFTKQVMTMDEVNQSFAKRIDEVKKKRNNILNYARQCMIALNEEKFKFKAFHENTIDYLKRTATLTEDRAVIDTCEHDICLMHKRFVKEVDMMKRSESVLLPFFTLLQESDPKSYCECCCFKDYDWMPLGSTIESVEQIANEFKDKMGKTLIRAFAELHIHQPQDPKSFIAGYLMNIERSEELMREKLEIFQNE